MRCLNELCNNDIAKIITFIKSVDKTCIYVYLLLLNFNLQPTDSHLSNYTTPNRYENFFDHCTISEFQCENGQCIDKIFFCNGITDCTDGSDETREECQNISCKEDFFQCNYGGCIKKEYQCDGSKQCIDGSDESAELCNVTKTEIRRKRAANDFCVAPVPSVDKAITYLCDGRESQYCNMNGYVREFTVATIKCNPGYSPLEGTHFRSVCHDKSWIPPIDNCYRVCDKLTPINVDLQCYRRGMIVSCENGLLAGTIVRPTCKPLHTYRDFVPTYHEITCQDDGKWDASLFSCIPECGRPYTNPSSLISGGVVERFGDSPWHVAVYNQDKILICGGTIIDPYLVVSAAHCFHDQSNRRKDPANFEIVVSKFTRDYNVVDNKNQKKIKLREIRFSSKGYIGINNYFAADIAILILQEKLIISPTVLPACVDWAGLRTNKYPPENTLAKLFVQCGHLVFKEINFSTDDARFIHKLWYLHIVGWGKNEHGKLSEMLMTANLPFISRRRCLDNVPDQFKAFITFDKFCAGTEEGPTVLQGDSGGGLLFRENNLYYLRGITSLKQPTLTAVAAFTDLADHIDWILAVRNEIEREMTIAVSTVTTKKPSLENICKSYGQTCVKVQNCASANSIISSNRAVVCDYDSSGKADSICCSLRDVVQNIPTTTISTQNRFPSYTQPQYTPPSIATAPPYRPPLTRPSRPQYNTPPAPVNRPQYNPRPPPVTEPPYMPNYPIISDTGSIKVTNVQPGEFPHSAIIGYGNEKDQYIEWACDGALISDKFVISAAHCGNTSNWGEPKWVMLGVSDIFSSTDKPKQTIYSIVKSYYNPYYNPSTFYNDVTIFQLNASVTTTPYIKPACVYTSTSNPINVKVSVTGWGTTGSVHQRGNSLQKSTLTVMEDEKCRAYYRSGTEHLEQGYDSNTMICAGDSNEGNELCVPLAGSPLQVPTRNQTCFWVILGIKSFGTSCGRIDDAQPDVFSKVSYHLDWIQRLVNRPT